MTLAPTSIEVSEPFGPAIVGRSLHIHCAVSEYVYATKGITEKDVSAARWTYKLRVWENDDDDEPITGMDVTVSKGSAAATGELDYRFKCGATVYATPVMFELVELDGDEADSSSRSGQVELLVMRWRQPILDAPIGTP